MAVASLAHSISVGFIFYSYGVFLKALTAEFGGGRFGVSAGLAIMNISIGLFAPFLGHAIDHRSVRNIMCTGAVLMACGFFLASRVESLLQFYLVLGGVLGLGVAMMGGLPASTLVVNWFVKRRGFALGISTMGVSMAGVIMAPVATQLIASIGWRYTFILFGLVILALVLPLSWRVIVNRPEDMGLYPDGESAPPVERELAPNPIVPSAPGEQLIEGHTQFEWSARDALRDRGFWVITIVFALNFFCMSATLTHLIPHATDLGITPANAALIVSCTAGIAMTGKFFFGLISDRIDIRIALWISITFQSMGALVLLNGESYSALLLGGGLFGFGMGGIVPLWRLLVGEIFGRRAFGRVTGLMNPCMLPLRAAGVPYAGYIFDRTGNYTIAFQTFLAAYLMAAFMTLFLPRWKSETNEAGAET